MADLGIVSGFVGKAIDLAVDEIITHIRTALCCERELRFLNEVVGGIIPLNRDIQRYRLTLKSGPRNGLPPVPEGSNEWLNKLNEHLENAKDLVEQCIIPRYNLKARYELSKKIRGVIADFEKHMQGAALVNIVNQYGQMLMRFGQGDATTSTSGTSPALASSHRQTKRVPSFREPPSILGQDQEFDRLLTLLTDVEENSPSRIGVVGMGGVGKTLLLRRLYNCEDVQRQYEKKSILWLTVSQDPSFPSLRIDLAKQLVAERLRTDANLITREQLVNHLNDRYAGTVSTATLTEDEFNERVKRLVDEELREGRFLIFLDDVWPGGQHNLLEKLSVPRTSNFKLAVSTRNRSVLLGMGVKPAHAIDIRPLPGDEAWRLFCVHAFPYNDQIPPSGLEAMARNVCTLCCGLPLAIKVIGAAMSGVTSPSEWELTLQRLHNAEKFDEDVQTQVYDRLKVSCEASIKYDLLDSHRRSSLQLCFLYLGSFREDQIIKVEEVIQLWIGEGLLGKTNDDEDPLLVGQTHVEILRDRCLIEARLWHFHNNEVLQFSVHDVLHGLTRQIAAYEENCLFRAGKALKNFPQDQDLHGRRIISLRDNRLSSIPDTFRGPKVRSLLLSGNERLNDMPTRVIQSLTSLRVLDLNGCNSLRSLPDALGCMRHLVYLGLSDNDSIERLPKSIARLKKLQTLIILHCGLRELPQGMDKLISLRYLSIRARLDLKCIPIGISRLTSLQHLGIGGYGEIAWVERGCRAHFKAIHGNRRSVEERESGGLKDRLHALTQLKRLRLQYDGEIIREGTLGGMTQMRDLTLQLGEAKALPDDMRAMSQLTKLDLDCARFVKIPNWVCEFEHLTTLALYCPILEKLPALQQHRGLKHMRLKASTELEALPAEFGKEGAFPALEVFQLVFLTELKELPALEEGALPLLKDLVIKGCPKLRELPQGILHLKNLKRIRVIDCPLVSMRMEIGGEYWDRLKTLDVKLVIKQTRVRGE